MWTHETQKKLEPQPGLSLRSSVQRQFVSFTSVRSDGRFGDLEEELGSPADDLSSTILPVHTA